MGIKISKTFDVKSDLLICPIFSENLKSLPKYFPAFVKEFLNERISKKEFLGKKGEIIFTYLLDKKLPAKLAVVGLGKKEKFNGKKSRDIAGILGKFCKQNKSVNVSILAPVGLIKYMEEFLEGGKLAQYSFCHFKTKQQEENGKYNAKEVVLVLEKDDKGIKEKISRAEIISDAVNYVRDLVNLPSNEEDSQFIVNEAKKIASAEKYKLEVFDKKDLEKMGWGGVLTVNLATPEKAKAFVIEYKGAKNKNARPVVIVGKGVIFDSGGYNLKPGIHLDNMHQDMAGAASILGVFKVLRKLKIKKNVIGICVLGENMIDGRAYRPTDIVKTLSGLTVEITNTDAEGRVMLADGITYADKFKPEFLLTIATLTGAAAIALGNRYSAIMGNDLRLRKAVYRAGKETDDLVWPLPIHPDFKKKIDSKIADIRNGDTGTAHLAGSQKGGAFLERFIKKNKWCHIDMGGTAFSSSDYKDYEVDGATGAGTRLLIKFLENL